MTDSTAPRTAPSYISPLAAKGPSLIISSATVIPLLCAYTSSPSHDDILPPFSMLYISFCAGYENVPLGPLLVQDAATAFLAPDGVASSEGELEAAVAADVVYRGALEVEGARDSARAARAGGVALARGDLVGLARH